MYERKVSVFSPCGELFVSINNVGILTVWETASNNVKQEFDVNIHLNTTCSSLIWGSFQIDHIEEESDSGDNQFILIGTEAGDIYLYDYSNGNLYNRFSSGHTSRIRDLSLHSETNHLYSCCEDKSIIVWDTVSGILKKKWSAGGEEIYSICAVNGNNLLTGGTSIIWWNIEEQSIIKKFQCKETPITSLRIVNSFDATSSYILSAAASDPKISAWSLNTKNCQNVVATFSLNSEPANIDVSKSFSKDNPLLLTAVTKTGHLLLFQHVLNGKTQNLIPQMTLRVQKNTPSSGNEPSFLPIISSKIMDCAESCIIVYGDDDYPIFESVNIFDCPKVLTLTRSQHLPEKVYDTFVSKVKLCKNLKGTAMTNGKSSPDPLCNSPKRKKGAQKNEENNTSKDFPESLDKIRNSNKILTNASPTAKKRLKVSKKQMEKSKTPESDSEDLATPTEPFDLVGTLLKGLEEEKMSKINSVLKCDDTQLIRASIKNFPVESLSSLLIELHKKLKVHDRRYNSSVIRWLKEILSYHLPYLITCDDLKEKLNKIRELVNNRNANQTLQKMNMVRGLLRVQVQNISSNESSSSESDIEELIDS